MTRVGLLVWRCHSDLTEYLLGFIQVTVRQFSMTRNLQSSHMARESLGMLPRLAYRGTLDSQLKTYRQIPCESQFKSLYIQFTFSWEEPLVSVSILQWPVVMVMAKPGELVRTSWAFAWCTSSNLCPKTAPSL